MKKKPVGFSLIELLVVVAILGALAGIGIVTYAGYTSSAKKSSAENVMQQIALMQTEQYSVFGSYYNADGDNCTPTSGTTEGIDTTLFDADTDENVISSDAGYEYCVAPHSSGYQVRACMTAKCDETLLTLDAKGQNNF